MTTQTMTNAPTLEQAVRFIAGRCDGARTRDDVGFDGQDTHFGRRIAAVPEASWSAEVRREVWRTLRKYRGQLETGGIDFDALPEPPLPFSSEDGVKRVARDDARRYEREARAAESRRVSLAPGAIEVRFDYDAGLVAECRALPGRRWNAGQKINTFPTSSARAVVEWADRYGFTVEADVRDLAAAQPQAEAAPAEPEKRIEREGDRLVLTAPYDAALVNACRSVPGRKWDGARKVNTFPASSAAEVALLGVQFGIKVPEDLIEQGVREQEAQAERREASEAADADVDVPGLGGELLPFQRAGVAYALRTRRTFIADEMGLGKTVQALAAIEATGSYPAVVVCPASLKLNWQREAAKWLPAERTVEVVSGLKCHEAEADVTVVNYDIVHAWRECLEGCRALILDESHYAKTPKARRTQAVEKLAQTVPEDGLVLALSGTPLTNRPRELVPQLRILGRLADFGGAKGFRSRYCGLHFNGYGWDDSGSSNLDELHDRLRSLCMVRRRKADVLPELPAKRRADLTVEGAPAVMAEYAEAEDDLLRWLAEQAEAAGENPVEAIMRAQRAEVLVRLNALRRLAARAKIPEVKTWVADFLESGEKLVLFAHHRDVLEALASEFDAPLIIGGQDATDRQAAVDAFQNDPAVRLIVCSIEAAGVGLTLTAASNVLLVERVWTPAAHDQAEDRCHRIGQHDSVTAWYATLLETVDERLAGIVEAKRQIVGQALDGAAAEQGDSVVAEVLRGYLAR